MIDEARLHRKVDKLMDDLDVALRERDGAVAQLGKLEIEVTKIVAQMRALLEPDRIEGTNVTDLSLDIEDLVDELAKLVAEPPERSE